MTCTRIATYAVSLRLRWHSIVVTSLIVAALVALVAFWPFGNDSRYRFAWWVIPPAMPALLRGLAMTLEITVVVIVIGLISSVFVAAGRLSGNPFISKPVAAYIELFRSTPALVQLIWVFYALPIVLGIDLASFTSIVIALSGNVSAFYGETIRAGIQAVPRDQIEAADVLGLSYRDRMRFVVLPQALRNVLPVLLSTSISLFKETSLVSSLGVADLMYTARMVSTQNYRPLELLTTAALIYFVVAFPFTLLARWLELRMARRAV
jgi:polar amino acid transport system permease protein